MTEPEKVLVLFNWQDRAFCDFVVDKRAWQKVAARRPSIMLPRKRHAPVPLTWEQLQRHLEVAGNERARAFLTAYNGLEANGTVDLWALLREVK